MQAKFPDAILKNAGMVSVHRRWSNESEKRQENRKMVDSVSLYGLAGAIIIQLLLAVNLRLVLGETLIALVGGIVYAFLMVHNGIWDKGLSQREALWRDFLTSVICAGIFSVLYGICLGRMGATEKQTIYLSLLFLGGITIIAFIVLRVLSYFNRKRRWISVNGEQRDIPTSKLEELHIDFIPYTTGSKRGLDTRVSLKQALSALGFKGGTRRETELNQWVAYEKEQLAAVMLEHGIEWEKKGTHEKHLSVLDFEKKERAKEVAELEARKVELQEENATFQEINEDLHEQLLQVDDEIRSLQEDLQESRQEAEKAQKQADKYQKRMNELAPMVKNMEKLAADFSADPEQTLPEAVVMESAKSYREKKAKPLVKKIVQVMRSVYSAYLDISNKFTKLQAAYNRERRGNERLTNRLEVVLEENRELRIVAADFERVKAVVGSEQVNAVINRAKQQEQIEAEQKRAAKRKHNRQAR